MIKRFLTLINFVFVLTYGELIYAQAPSDTTTLRKAGFHVDFRWDKAVLQKEYLDNHSQLKALSDTIHSLQQDSSRVINNIERLSVKSYSSPEGAYEYNARLARRRADAMLRFLSSEYGSLSDRIYIEADGESWHMFRDKVLSDKVLSEDQREHLLEIIDADLPADKKKTLLKTYDAALYRRMIKEYFVDMRRSFITLEWTSTLRHDPGEMLSQAQIPFTLEAPQGKGGGKVQLTGSSPKTLVALKTNLLYDVVTALNVEVEIPIGEKFSVAVSDLFPWWTAGPNGHKYAFQIWELGIEPRYYPTATRQPEFGCFNDSRMTGWFVGPYLSSATYDLQWDKKICTQGEYWSLGASAGYVMPVGRRLRFEFSASIGYLRSDYRHYQPTQDYEHLYKDPFKAGIISYFGLTRAKVSLILPLSVRKQHHTTLNVRAK